MHIPVLLSEVIEYLKPEKDQKFIDCTANGGGHIKEILKYIKPKGEMLGIEIDPCIYRNLKKEKIKRLTLINDSYINLEKVAGKNGFMEADGILFDLGMSSWHFDESKRGFSFQKNEDLIQRYDADESKLTAKDILNTYLEEELIKILREYGEEKFARRIASKIIEERPIQTTQKLVETIKEATPSWYHHKKIHFATKTFQALRIETNQELENLKTVLPQTLKVLKHGGRLAIISFHSLEDRIVKVFFKEMKKNQEVEILTKKPIIATREEIISNPKSRSAKLRVIIKK